MENKEEKQHLSDTVNFDNNIASPKLPPLWKTFHVSPQHINMFLHFVETKTKDYTYQEVAQFMNDKAIPLRVPGDGNCLLHAISYALWGSEASYHEELRWLLRLELTEFRNFYKNSVDKAKEDEESQGYSDSEYDILLKDASSRAAFLGFLHIFALSNILKRPIVVYAGDKDIETFGVHEEGCAGLFLPTRHGAEQCMGPPIALAWSDEKKNHIVPVLPAQGCNISWPLLDVVFKKTLKTNETSETYVKFGMKVVANPPPEEPEETNEKRDYDVVFHISLSMNNRTVSPPIPIGFDLCENPITVARYWCQKYDLPFESLDREKLENLIREKMCEEIEKRRKFEPNHIFPKNRIYRFLKKRKPSYKCPFVPYSEPFKTSPLIQLESMFKKIVQINQEIEKSQNGVGVEGKGQNRYFVLNPDEISLIQVLVTTLDKYKKSSHFDGQFSPGALDLITKLLEQWPNDKVYPVIDLARVLILHESAANHYFTTVKTTENNIFGHVLKLASAESKPYNNIFLTLKFVCNLFHQKVLHPLLLNYQNKIAAIVLEASQDPSYNPDQISKILKLVTLIFINFSSLWKGGNYGPEEAHIHTLSFSVNKLFDIMFDNTNNDEITADILVALGTIILDDARIVLDSSRFAPFTDSKVEKIKLVSNYVIHLLECDEELVQE